MRWRALFPIAAAMALAACDGSGGQPDAGGDSPCGESGRVVETEAQTFCVYDQNDPIIVTGFRCADEVPVMHEVGPFTVCSDSGDLSEAFFGALRDNGIACYGPDHCLGQAPTLAIDAPEADTALDVWEPLGDAKGVEVAFTVDHFTLDQGADCDGILGCGEVRARIDGDTCNAPGRSYNAASTASPVVLDFSHCPITAGPHEVELALHYADGTAVRNARAERIAARVSVTAEARPRPCASGVQVDPASLDFASVAVGHQSALTFDVVNPDAHQWCRATAALIASGTSFSLALPADGLVLEPGQRKAVTVRFAPDRQGEFAGLVRVEGEGWPSTATVDLVGRASMAAVRAQDDAVSLPDLPVGCLPYVESQACLTSDDDVPVTLVATFVDDPAFRVTSAMPRTLRPGRTDCVDVRFAAAAPGAHQARLYFYLGTGDVITTTLTANAYAEPAWTETVVQDGRREADILWVVDSGGSMGLEQQRLAADAGDIVDYLELEDISYRIGVTTMDTGDGVTLFPSDGSNHPIVVPPLSDPASVLATNFIVGNYGSYLEEGFQKALDVLTDRSDFRRPDAHLRLVFVSDEDDQSSGTVTSFLDAFGDLPAASFAAAAIAGPTGGCSSPEGVAAEGVRYLQLAGATGAPFASICGSEWTPVYRWLADSVGYRTRFTLEGTPGDVSSVEVRDAQGEVRTVAFSWDPVDGVVILDTAPSPGETVTIAYTCGG